MNMNSIIVSIMYRHSDFARCRDKLAKAVPRHYKYSCKTPQWCAWKTGRFLLGSSALVCSGKEPLGCRTCGMAVELQYEYSHIM